MLKLVLRILNSRMNLIARSTWMRKCATSAFHTVSSQCCSHIIYPSFLCKQSAASQQSSELDQFLQPEAAYWLKTAQHLEPGVCDLGVRDVPWVDSGWRKE
eukprot:5773025-Pleurochrysis_carterae.AAC.2